VPELQQILPGMTQTDHVDNILDPVSVLSPGKRQTSSTHTKITTNIVDKFSAWFIFLILSSYYDDLASFASHDQPSTHSSGAKDEVETSLIDT
jgi:hypothetical protein